MYKIIWDSETGGVRMLSHFTVDTLPVSPRPVFYEELDMLKLDKLGWQYPRCQEPLLWACNKQYFYRGAFVFEVKGANIYDDPIVIFQAGQESLSLIPVDVNEMLNRVGDEVFLLESEAVEYIRNIFTQYSTARKSVEKVAANQIDFEVLAANLEKRTKSKMAIVKQDCDSFDVMPLELAQEQGKKTYHTTRIDKFLASFSGGKDSQVVLDLCTRAIPPESFEVIYSDTGYELPPSLALYDKVIEYYHQKFPTLKFSVARNHENVINYWDKIGTPSDTHRWCCSIMKTAPLYRMLKVEGTNKQARILTFDGVRAEESTRRSGYNREGKSVKHFTVLNVSPILYWNTTEIFLYLFKNNLPINPAYRYGMTRVGCLICPFSSEWNDCISRKCFSKSLKPFLSRIEAIVNRSNIPDKKDYIRQGNWKRRAGGRGLASHSFVQVLSTTPDLEILVTNPQKNILTWLNAVCEYGLSANKCAGEIKYEKIIYPFVIESKGNALKITFKNTHTTPTLQGLLKRAIYKSTYCINCEACEVECPTGALAILPEAKIDAQKCVHCHKCLDFHEFGCIVAHSLVETSSNKNKMKLTGYNNFGFNGEWLDVFMSSADTYFSDNLHGLNVKEQLPNFVKWLVQAEILDDTKSRKLTELGSYLVELYAYMPDLVWEVIWVNLSCNAPIVKWFIENTVWNISLTESDVREKVMFDYPTDSRTTIKNIVYALFRTFRECPIGERIMPQQDKQTYIKTSYNDASREVIAYSIYKFAQSKNISELRVADLYDNNNKCGIYREFGIDKDTLISQLRSLNSDINPVLNATFNMGLDHISLRSELNPVSVLKLLTE
ncbi:phosphoadenosine phosphosulfate reductase domain-containing protein [Parabacteroides massiliensis]|uniref:phosphoadenosine phosphosulfate reductase domain-containing protein n=1 Tax=Parabacteroides massiliensis TaxID=1750560 RepID=UPI00096A318E|nr:phosphoadenosine phosphosulfate reductase family protein [Parabacteroides massiliensis]